MNQIAKPTRDEEEVAQIREIVGRHEFPLIVKGFDVRLGDFDGDPALWVIFETTADETRDLEQRMAQGDELNAFTNSVRDDLLAAISDRYPFFRFRERSTPAADGD